MMSPVTAFLAGMGTLAAVLALGTSTAVMLSVSSSVEQQEPSLLERRASSNAVETLPIPGAAAAASPVITAAQAPIIAPPFSAPPAVWTRAPLTTGQSSGRMRLAPDPGMVQLPVHPAAPFEAAAAASAQSAANARETVRDADTDGVNAESRKKRSSAAPRKPRNPVVAAPAASAYAREPGGPLGLFDFTGDARR